MDGELWHIVEAKRDDGTPTMFRIRELDPQKQLTRIFVVELPYPTMELSRLPTADAYRRLGELEEQWLRPACSTLGWEIVGSKTEDGSFFLYMYGASDPAALVERISPFDAALGFYDDEDPDWLEYATLRELLDQAKAMPALEAVALPELTVPLPAKSGRNGANSRTNGVHVAPPSTEASAPKKTAPMRKTATAKAATKSAAPKKPAAAKAPAAKTAASKSAATRKPARKSAVAKAAATKTAATKSAAPKKRAMKRPAMKSAAARSGATNKPASKQSAATKSAATKSAATKTAAPKTAATKSAATTPLKTAAAKRSKTAPAKATRRG